MNSLLSSFWVFRSFILDALELAAVSDRFGMDSSVNGNTVLDSNLRFIDVLDGKLDTQKGNVKRGKMYVVHVV